MRGSKEVGPMNRRTGTVLLPFMTAAFLAVGPYASEARAQAAPTNAPVKYEVTVERNVAAKMRDGVTLRADIYRPQAPGKFPVLLERTPYDKRTGEFGMRGAERGYVVIIQDT